MIDTLAALIDSTTAEILDSWTRAAALAGMDADDYIALKLDAMESTDADTAKVLSAAYLRRVLA